MELTFILIGLFILGTIFGSFGSVLMLRLSKGVNKKNLQSILLGFSYCPHCKKQLKRKNLIPIFSFFWQKGKCKNCSRPVSKLYPLLEIFSGILFVLSFLFVKSLGFGIDMIIFWLIMNRLLLLLIIYDFQKLELHVPLWGIALIVSLGTQFFSSLGNYHQAFFLSLFFGGICLLFFYGAQWYVKHSKKYSLTILQNGLTEGFGQGDVMMGFLIGTLMSFVFLFNQINFSRIRTIEMLILFFTLSAILGIFYFILKNFISSKFKIKKSNVSKTGLVPFIPFMVFAFWILLFGGKFFIHLFFPRG